MLLPRLITAVVGVPLILVTVYWGGIPFFVLMLGIVFLSLREYFLLAEQGGYGTQSITGIILGLLLFVSIFLNGTMLGPLAENQGTAAFLGIVLLVIFFREMLRNKTQRAIERLSVTFLGVFLIPWMFGHLILLRSLRPGGMHYVYFLFILIWIIDTAAYAVGKRFGKYHLAEIVSPKKTIEGAIGGTVAGIVVALLCRVIFLSDFLGLAEACLLGLSVSLVSQFSDLAESLLKRDVGVKDSANLLPGHGGMLDRFDSFLFTAPFLYYYLTIFKGN